MNNNAYVVQRHNHERDNLVTLMYLSAGSPVGLRRQLVLVKPDTASSNSQRH